jgi:hypothetical protein
VRRRGLRNLGYRTGSPDADVTVFLLKDGHHQQASWAKMLPLFLRWAFPSAPGR